MKIYFIIILIGLCGCQEKTEELLSVSDEKLVTLQRGSVPYLTKDNKANTVLSWTKDITDSTHVFCYAISKDGKEFNEPVVIPGSENIHPHSENLPKVIFKPSGEAIALWGVANPNPKNKHSGLVYYSQTFDEGKTWTKATKLVGDTSGIDQRYYDVALLKNGEIAIVWLDNRKTNGKDGSALYYATTNGRNGFQNEKLISQSCCQCCRTDLFIDSRNNIHVLYRGIVQDSIRDMVHISSNDGGANFSEPKRISEDNWIINGCPHTGPSMTENNYGLQFAWFTGGKNKGCYYTNSTDYGKNFARKDSVSILGSHPQIKSLSTDNLILAWDETFKSGEQFFKRVGLQYRDAKGKNLSTVLIDNQQNGNTYPVLSDIDANKLIVAYTVSKGKENFVGYRTITVR